MCVVVLVSISAFMGCAKTATLPKNASAEEMYKAAVYDMKRGLYPESMKAFERIRSRYPYSPFAPLSELRIADCHFESGQHLEAIESYRMFIQFHPRHREAAYAAYRIGEAHMKRAPRDWWFMPPAHEKDLSAIRQGVLVLQEFLKSHSGNAYEKEALTLLNKGRTRLGEHEMYVSNFYFKRQAFKAAAGRAEFILLNYRGTGLEPQAHIIAAKSYQQLKQLPKAAFHLKSLMQQFPDSKKAGQARKMLDDMRSGLSKQPVKNAPATDGREKKNG